MTINAVRPVLLNGCSLSSGPKDLQVEPQEEKPESRNKIHPVVEQRPDVVVPSGKESASLWK
jgi:hypothetical protein